MGPKDTRERSVEMAFYSSVFTHVCFWDSQPLTLVIDKVHLDNLPGGPYGYLLPKYGARARSSREPLPVLMDAGFPSPSFKMQFLCEPSHCSQGEWGKPTGDTGWLHKDLLKHSRSPTGFSFPHTPTHRPREAHGTTRTLFGHCWAFLGVIILLPDAFLSCSFKFKRKR